MNKVELTGKIYNVKVSTTATGKKISRFGLSIYNGKDREGKSQYGFIDCKYFGEVQPASNLKDISGRVTIDAWEKDGKKFSKVEILVDTINQSAMFANKKQETFDDDELGAIFG